MHYNTGYQREAIPLVRRFVRVFGDAEASSARRRRASGWSARRYPRRPSSPATTTSRARSRRCIPRVFELTEFLVDELGVEDVGAYFPHRVTYHPTCHSLRMLHVGDARCGCCARCAGSTSSSCDEAEECCGFGGTFAVKNADTSMAMLADKLRRVLDTRAEVCAAADNSCLMHIGGALHRQRAGARTIHLAEILAARE